ncbi:unnamed protein product, partial [Hapterophycus canaliculatus]
AQQAYHATRPKFPTTARPVRRPALEFRYGNMRFNKQSRQKMFAIWAKKEHRNLLRLFRAGIPCPEPIKQREHTLVLSFIGADHWP